MRRAALVTCAALLLVGIAAFSAAQPAAARRARAGSRCSTARSGATGIASARPTGAWKRRDRRRQAHQPVRRATWSARLNQGLLIYVEFWASDDANSGIFLRCPDPTKFTDRTCYEVNIFDQRKDPTYGTGGIVNFVEVNRCPRPAASGTPRDHRQGTAHRSGAQRPEDGELHNGLFTEGPFALQHGAGVIKFRKVAIKPL